jgi:hypothetical protein
LETDRWRHIEALFHEAAALAPSERPAFLSRVCGEDPELRREVESLLTSDVPEDRFIEAAVSRAADELPANADRALGVNGPAQSGVSEALRRSVSAGTRLGPYEIVSPIGSGGMGKVYRAHDVRLDRAVAVKILSDCLSQDTQLMHRFHLEARAVSRLNHPHICTLHDVGHQAGIDYLVMEYLEGETLAERLRKGPLPLHQALEVSIDIAGALDHAHQRGVIHRDLKPGNIVLTKSGAKVLDFGLAKVQTADAAEGLSQRGLSVSGEGPIMGTLQYMAPEQLEGKAIDCRADIFAFGAVMYEMVTGQTAFEGESWVGLTAAILKGDPKTGSKYRALSPPMLDRIVGKCLSKEPIERWQNIADVRDALRWVNEGATPKRRQWLAWTAPAVLGAAAFGILLNSVRPKPPEAGQVRFSFAAPANLPFIDISVSPDGRKLVMTATEQTVGTGLWLRSLNSGTVEELPVGMGQVNGGGMPIVPYPERDTRHVGNVYNPFWSADSRFIAFFTPGTLNKIRLAGPPSVQTIWSHRPSGARGGTWNGEDVIIIPNSLTGGLLRVGTTGEISTGLTALSPARQEIVHRYPQFLPDGRHFLYWVWSASEEYTGIYLGSLDPDINRAGQRPLVRTLRKGLYTLPGYLLFIQGPTLFAQQFDARTLRLSGEPIELPARIATGRETGQAFFAASNGVLAYQEASLIPEYRILQLDRRGKQLRAIHTALRSAGTLSLSPDGKQVAIDGNGEADVEEIWIVDLERAVSSPLVASLTSNYCPVWERRGHRILFESNRRGAYDLYVKDSNNLSLPEQVLLASEDNKVPTDWSRDAGLLSTSNATRRPISISGCCGQRETSSRFPLSALNLMNHSENFHRLSTSGGACGWRMRRTQPAGTKFTYRVF